MHILFSLFNDHFHFQLVSYLSCFVFGNNQVRFNVLARRRQNNQTSKMTIRFSWTIDQQVIFLLILKKLPSSGLLIQLVLLLQQPSHVFKNIDFEIYPFFSSCCSGSFGLLPPTAFYPAVEVPMRKSSLVFSCFI